jgi:hypothetical protein
LDTAHDEPIEHMAPHTTAEIIDRFNHAFVDHEPNALNDLDAFRLHDPGLLEDLIADDCVIEDTSPAPDGELAVQPWALQWGDGEQDRVRGVNLIRIRDSRIVEARGYVKA